MASMNQTLLAAAASQSLGAIYVNWCDLDYLLTLPFYPDGPDMSGKRHGSGLSVNESLPSYVSTPYSLDSAAYIDWVVNSGDPLRTQTNVLISDLASIDAGLDFGIYVQFDENYRPFSLYRKFPAALVVNFINDTSEDVNIHVSSIRIRDPDMNTTVHYTLADQDDFSLIYNEPDFIYPVLANSTNSYVFYFQEDDSGNYVAASNTKKITIDGIWSGTGGAVHPFGDTSDSYNWDLNLSNNTLQGFKVSVRPSNTGSYFDIIIPWDGEDDPPDVDEMHILLDFDQYFELFPGTQQTSVEVRFVRPFVDGSPTIVAQRSVNMAEYEHTYIIAHLVKGEEVEEGIEWSCTLMTPNECAACTDPDYFMQDLFEEDGDLLGTSPRVSESVWTYQDPI